MCLSYDKTFRDRLIGGLDLVIVQPAWKVFDVEVRTVDGIFRHLLSLLESFRFPVAAVLSADLRV